MFGHLARQLVLLSSSNVYRTLTTIQDVSWIDFNPIQRINERRNALVDMSGRPPGAGLIPGLGIGEDISSIDLV